MTLFSISNLVSSLIDVWGNSVFFISVSIIPGLLPLSTDLVFVS